MSETTEMIDTMGNDFFTVGNEAVEEENARARERQEQYDNKRDDVLREYWIKTDEDNCYLRFLTDEASVVSRHRLYKDGKWMRYTCFGKPVDGKPVCPLCRAGIKASPEGVHLVIDRRTFTSKKGDVYKNELKVLALGTGHVKSLMECVAETPDKTIKKEWKMKRTGSKAATKYAIYLQPTEPLPEDEKRKYQEELGKFAEVWKAFKTRRKLEKFPLERYVALKTLSPLSYEALDKIAREYEAAVARAEAGQGPDPSSASSAPSHAAPPPPNVPNEDDYEF
jgi:hypothetical protein